MSNQKLGHEQLKHQNRIVIDKTIQKDPLFLIFDKLMQYKKCLREKNH